MNVKNSFDVQFLIALTFHILFSLDNNNIRLKFLFPVSFNFLSFHVIPYVLT